jgi:hypothetical protein
MQPFFELGKLPDAVLANLFEVMPLNPLTSIYCLASVNKSFSEVFRSNAHWRARSLKEVDLQVCSVIIYFL